MSEYERIQADSERIVKNPKESVIIRENTRESGQTLRG